jgi:hypothetical protein
MRLTSEKVAKEILRLAAEGMDDPTPYEVATELIDLDVAIGEFEADSDEMELAFMQYETVAREQLEG